MSGPPIVHDAEKFKAMFIADYERLCKRYGLAVVHVQLDRYAAFGVVVLDDTYLSQQLEEMRLEPINYLTKE